MKVLHILDTLNRGGIEMLTLDVCRNAGQNGLDLAFATCGGGPMESDFRDSGIDVFRLERRLPLDPLLIARLHSLIKSESIDVVHSHLAVAGIHAYLASRGTKAKNVLSFHGFYATAKERRTTNFLIPRMSANISCSHGLIEWLSDVEKVDIDRNFTMIYNGVDAKRLEYRGEDLRTELGLADDALLFGMVAHFYAAPRKDQITLCRAFVRAAREMPNAHLILVGSVESGGEAKYDQCVEICREADLLDRVHFLGRRDDLAKVTNSLDICVLSSLHEGLPIALMEAMLTRKPCILSDIPPHLEVSHDGLYAEVFRTQDADELYEKLMLLGRDVNHRTKLAGRAYDFAAATFSIEAHIANLNRLYASLD